MMTRRAAGEAAKRLALVWIAATIVVLIGLVVFRASGAAPPHGFPTWLAPWLRLYQEALP